MSFTYVNLGPGDPAPWFHARSTTSPRYAFDTVAGRYIVLCFLGTADDMAAKAALDAIGDNRGLFDDNHISLFGVTINPADYTEGRVKENLPGIRFFLDFDAAVSRIYGAAPRDAGPDGKLPLRRFWMVLDPTLRVLKVFPFLDNDTRHEAFFAFLRALPTVDLFAGVQLQAPVLYLPNVFEPEFCQTLIGIYEQHGGEESGFMREVAGQTVGVNDRNHKVRKDHTLTDQALIRSAHARIERRIIPEIAKVHQFQVTRIERNMVGCYTAEDGGHFRAHRDNTTKGTAHRRFAVSINLNADFEGGEVSFPEYGSRSFKPPPGGAVIFSCSLLHAVSKVTRGARYAFLPFLYDDAAAKLRQDNLAFLENAGSA